MVNGDNIGIYKGQTINSIPSGTGIWTGDNGDKYAGNWIDGKRNGSGIYINVAI
ncbi:hypothetical protein [Desulfosporosinus metallidurans]|uniref:Uncharacterized protein n=1 Tax=Desulfosporosinus metallidurans TaxID=1888891 RepID=A0A1Q8QLA8_9FIRM|nr:hypothetical protein DSOL_4236 [Desulfosporosinus metallidurans]